MTLLKRRKAANVVAPDSGRGMNEGEGCAGGADLRGKRVLVLFPHMVLPGGALEYMLKLALLLARKGATVGILTMQLDLRRYGSVEGVELLTVGGPVTSSLGYWLFFPLWQMKMNRMIEAWEPDVLVPHVFPANWWAWLYKRKNRDAVVVWICHEPSAFIHSRNWIDALQPFWKRFLARTLNPLLACIDISLSRFSDKIVANSMFTSEMIGRIYHRKADAVAYPAIDFRLYFPVEVERDNAIITVAKLSRFKRVDFLLRVFARVLKRYPGLVYHVVGRGEDENGLKALAKQLDISANVIFHGNIDAGPLAELHRRSLLFLHGSVEEPFGMAPLEAIACGTPVIAHNSGGPREFVNGACGALIDSLLAETWCKEICDFLAMLKADPAYFRGVPEHARKFDWETTLQPVIRLVGESEPGDTT